jgi:hypothetical protein
MDLPGSPGTAMRLVRSRIGMLVVVTLVTLLGVSATSLLGVCCPADGADTRGCRHHDAGSRTAASSETTHPEACPMHEEAQSPKGRDTQSDCTLVCGCTTDPETAVFDTVGLATPPVTVAPPLVAATSAHMLTSVPSQRLRLPAVPPPRVRPA